MKKTRIRTAQRLQVLERIRPALRPLASLTECTQARSRNSTTRAARRYGSKWDNRFCKQRLVASLPLPSSRYALTPTHNTSAKEQGTSSDSETCGKHTCESQPKSRRSKTLTSHLPIPVHLRNQIQEKSGIHLTASNGKSTRLATPTNNGKMENR
jgi:hypothetical protein